jgi:hypothetical protein
VLANEVDNHPSTFALLNMCEGERSALGTPQAATDENRKQRSIALARKRLGIRRVDRYHTNRPSPTFPARLERRRQAREGLGAFCP